MVTGWIRAARLEGNGHTHVFLNTEGEPWTTNAVHLQMARLRKKLQLAPDLCAYRTHPANHVGG